MTITLAELRTQSRQRADQENSEFVSDSELTSYINSSVAELHDLLVQSYGSDYFLELNEFSTVANQQDYDLAADFYKLRGVDAKLNGSDFFTLKRFNFNERNRFEGFGIWSLTGIAHVRYRLMGNKLRLSPMPDTNVDIKVWYIPVATKLVADGDTLDDLNQFAEYVIVDATIKMLQKEESDVTVLFAQKAELKRRIETAAQNRDAGESESVSDVHAENNDFFYWRSGG